MAMMSIKNRFVREFSARHLLFRCSVLLGILLSGLLVAETVNTYRYVERGLVREEANARRTARSGLLCERLGSKTLPPPACRRCLKMWQRNTRIRSRGSVF